jgi:IPT/TIG domain-containing protein
MLSPTRGLSLVALLAVLFFPGCSNTLNPFCGSARPAPMIGSLSPTTVSFAQVQQGSPLTVNGSHFVASSIVLVNDKPLATSVLSDGKLKVMLTSGVISGPGTVNIQVQTPSGNTSDLGCSSGGSSSVLALKVN